MYALIHGFAINGVFLAANLLIWRYRLEKEDFRNQNVNHFVSNYLKALGFSIIVSLIYDIFTSLFIVS